MSATARKRQAIIYCIEQVILTCIMFAGFAGVLVGFRTLMEIAM